MKQVDFEPLGYSVKPVRMGDEISFHCRKCAECCRYVEGKIMLELLDAYRLGQFLRECSEDIGTTADIYARFTDPVPLTPQYPIFTLKTEGSDQHCIFLKDGRCSIYEARPRACRLYPFSANPSNDLKTMKFVLTCDTDCHFSGGRVNVGRWFHDNLDAEMRRFVMQDAENTRKYILAERLLPADRHGTTLPLFLQAHYLDIRLNLPFWRQYRKNTAQLQSTLAAMMK